MASTFSDASDFSEPSYAPGEQSSAMLKVLGPLAGTLTAQERGIRKLNVSGDAFAAACTRFVRHTPVHPRRPHALAVSMACIVTNNGGLV
jgi:hypothetical protein